MRTWRDRCYNNDIPDEAPKKLEDSGRVPSYRRIAIAILKNDLNFHSLGFSRDESDLSLRLMEAKKNEPL